MGTRADFYVGRGASAEWLGSIAWDGYPNGGEPEVVLAAVTEAEFRAEVADLLARQDDATTPELGWPWPWENSRGSDFSYWFDQGNVWVSEFGRKLAPAADFYAWTESDEEGDPPPGEDFAMPDMSQRQAVTFGSRSGLIVVSAPAPGAANNQNNGESK